MAQQQNSIQFKSLLGTLNHLTSTNTKTSTKGKEKYDAIPKATHDIFSQLIYQLNQSPSSFTRNKIKENKESMVCASQSLPFKILYSDLKHKWSEKELQKAIEFLFDFDKHFLASKDSKGTIIETYCGIISSASYGEDALLIYLPFSRIEQLLSIPYSNYINLN